MSTKARAIKAEKTAIGQEAERYQEWLQGLSDEAYEAFCNRIVEDLADRGWIVRPDSLPEDPEERTQARWSLVTEADRAGHGSEIVELIVSAWHDEAGGKA